MSRPVPLFPSLPRSPNAPVLDQMVQFDADLTRSLFLYLSDLARRVNDALTVDGADPMEGNLNLGGFDIINSGDITSERIRLTAPDDASLASTLHPFQIGPTAGANIIMDGNETMARNNGAASTYFINVEGGNIQLGNTSSILTLTGGKIAFPATQQASADPNTLDDYEEGTWTPVYSPASGAFGSLTMDYQGIDPSYTKVGEVVTLDFICRTSAITVGTAGGQLRITGQPFTQKAGTQASMSPGYRASWVNKPEAIIISGAVFLFYKDNGATGLTTLSAATDVDYVAGNKNDLRMVISYLA